MSLALLRDRILPDTFNGTNSKFVDCVLDKNSVGQDQFMSNVVFLTAIVQKDGEKTEIPLIVKVEPFNVELRKFLNTVTQFYNEVLVYREVLPFLDRNNICGETFAKFYHGVGELGASTERLVIVQDLKPLGFKLTEERAFIDYEHLSLAMKALGRFHALSFAAKKDRPREFFELAQRLRETSWNEDCCFFPVIKACIRRGAEALMKKGKHVEVLQKLLDCVDSNIIGVMKHIVDPEKPSAVICHGDFCRNNILFKYSEGHPVDVKFFDLATARYSSPVIDISFFLLLNSSSKTREEHWNDLLKDYHQALFSAVPGVEVPSLEDIHKEMRKKALYGYVHCAFFLPQMLYENPFSMDLLLETPMEEIAREHVRIGEEEGTNLLSDMLEELIDRGCLNLQHKFLEI